MNNVLVRHPPFIYLQDYLVSSQKKPDGLVYRKIYLPINFTYIDEMMTFLRKLKFPIINIAIIISITNQNRFVLWSDVFIFGTIHYLGQGISVLINCAMPSPVSDISISYSPCTLYFHKVKVTPENIEGQLITSQQSLTQFFKSTSNKQKPKGPDYCNKKMQNTRRTNV